MSDEFAPYPDLPVNLDVMLAQRVAQKTSLPPPGTVDPYQVMLQRKKQAETGEAPPLPAQQWPEADVKALEDYCKKMGIVGFSTRQNPRIALMQLQKQFGEDYTGVPLEERIPAGYEKVGTHSNQYGPGNRYSDSVTKKQVLHG